MKVRYTPQDSRFPEEIVDTRLGLTRNRERPLTVGAVYRVYAITVFKGLFWYYLLDNDAASYPIWYPAPLFEVADATLSRRWIVNYLPNTFRPERIGTSVIAFAEWANDPTYYERLVDGDPGAMTVFRRERELIEGE
jgi:hypothetical protein